MLSNLYTDTEIFSFCLLYLDTVDIVEARYTLLTWHDCLGIRKLSSTQNSQSAVFWIFIIVD